ncbi:MAG TPA: SPOR domain-containing protein [Acidobacteriaceae bacterium]
MRTYTDQVGRDDRMGPIHAEDDGEGLDRAADLQADEPRDFTLGMTALLGIFFAVVLVCAVFFGFGYSSGRTLHAGKRPIMSPQPSAQVAPETTSASPVAPSPAPQVASKPSAGAALSESLPQPQADDSPGLEAQSLPRSQPARAAYVPAPPAPAAPAAPAFEKTSSAVMVQIAAVMHPQDAEALAQALRRNGYAAVVRTSPQDKFLHVQVGPYPSREQAKAMRARLQADGYDPILKP